MFWRANFEIKIFEENVRLKVIYICQKNKEQKESFIFRDKPWRLSSGQSACLILRVSEFEYTYSFSVRMLFENKHKTGRVGPLL